MRSIIVGVLAFAACGGGGDDDGQIDAKVQAPPNTGYVQVSSQSFVSGTTTVRVGSASASFAPAGMGSFSASSVSNKTTDVGDWRVYAQGFFTSIWSDMSAVSATAMIQ